MLYTKEFYETMKFFEKVAPETVNIGSQGLTKEPKELWTKKRYYCDGNLNNAFVIFLSGYMLGQAS